MMGNTEHNVYDLMGSRLTPPDLRARLHGICALYAHTRGRAERIALLEQLEQMALEAAQILAIDMLENGWRPDVKDSAA